MLKQTIKKLNYNKSFLIENYYYKYKTIEKTKYIIYIIRYVAKSYIL